MLRHIHRIVLGAFLALVALTGSASAECAWVLWAESLTIRIGTGWNINGTFQSRAQCISALRTNLGPVGENVGLDETRGQGKSSNPSGHIIFRCLPDTVDPRAPRGGGR